MQLQLERHEAAEYARIRHKLFKPWRSLTIDDATEADPDFQRYLVLNRKMQRFYRFHRRLMKASPAVYHRVQTFVENRTGGQWISGISPGYGMELQ
jgi:hypothetical protein